MSIITITLTEEELALVVRRLDDEFLSTSEDAKAAEELAVRLGDPRPASRDEDQIAALLLHRTVLSEALIASNSERAALRQEIEGLRSSQSASDTARQVIGGVEAQTERDICALRQEVEALRGEREATVRWLRSQECLSEPAADAIERGDHRR